MLKPLTTDIEALKILDERLRWLSAWTIHYANHIRDNEDGLKVGGHQASCASMTAIMAALYFHALGPNDRVAVKPHAGPVLHAIHYLLGSQSLEQLQNFRQFDSATPGHPESFMTPGVAVKSLREESVMPRVRGLKPNRFTSAQSAARPS